MTYSRISGTGRYLPEKLVTNADLEKIVDTTDEWIRTRTGIEQRHLASEDESTSDLCVEAARKAMDSAGVSEKDIDAIFVGTTSPDLIFPNIATIIQHKMGIPACPCYATEAACSSFVYALSAADKFVKLGDLKCVLVIGAEIITKLVDWEDRSTAILFGDGAGAIVLESSSGGGKLLGWDLSSSGELRDILHAPIGFEIQSKTPAEIAVSIMAEVTAVRNGIADLS